MAKKAALTENLSDIDLTDSFTQGINESANFRSCRGCLSYSVSTETVRDLLLPAETTVHEKWLPAETVRAILLPVETRHHMDSLCRKLFPKHNSIGRKQEIADSLGGSQI